MIPIPRQHAVAHLDVARQRYDETVRHRVDERRALLDRAHLGRGYRRKAVRGIVRSHSGKRVPRGPRSGQTIQHCRIAAKDDLHGSPTRGRSDDARYRVAPSSVARFTLRTRHPGHKATLRSPRFREFLADLERARPANRPETPRPARSSQRRAVGRPAHRACRHRNCMVQSLALIPPSTRTTDARSRSEAPLSHASRQRGRGSDRPRFQARRGQSPFWSRRA